MVGRAWLEHATNGLKGHEEVFINQLLTWKNVPQNSENRWLQS
jgi:hypothetical protein